MNILAQNYLTRGFWGDEAWTALISQFSLPEIVRITGEDFHPPGYYFLVHGFIKLFGASEWIRLISVVFYVATGAIAYLLMKKLVGKGAAVAAGMLVLASPILFTYAFEARAYAMLAFLSTATTLVLWNLLRNRGKKWWVMYVLLGAMGVYTHYYMWFILVAHGVYWLVAERTKIIKMLTAFGAILLAQLPWIPSLLSQVSSVADDYWIAPIDKRTHWEFFIRITGGDYDTPQRMFAVVTILILLIASVAVMVIKHKKLGKGYLLLWMWLVVPIIIPSLISVFRPVFFYRYLIFSAIPISMLWLWGVHALRQSVGCGMAAFVVALYLSINLLGWQRYPYTMREEMDKIYTETKEKQFKLVTVLPSFAEVMYYNRGRAPVRVLPEGIVQFSGKSLLDAMVRQGKVNIAEVGEKETYWLIEPGPKASWHSPSD